MKFPLSPCTRRVFLEKSCAAMAGLGASLAAGGALGGLFPLPALAATGPGRIAQQSRLLMGTIVTLTALSPDSALAGEAFALAFAEIERLSAIFDRHNPASAISCLNANASLTPAPPELAAVLGSALVLGKATGQTFNPAIAPVVDLLEAAKRARVGLPAHSDADMQEALALAAPGGIRIERRAIRLERQGMRLTLDGIAKGHIADAASGVLAASGLVNHMVNAGGDIRASGGPASGKPWTIGIQHPGTAAALLAAVPVSGGIATSGSYVNHYERTHARHHLISQRTGKSADITSMTVRAPLAGQADGLATALSLMPPMEALRHVENLQSVSCFIVDRQGRCFASAGWG
ncbi:MAG: FAD:protein FMN transferase [Desulfovibrio sp.]|jgi:thiamine biosynthesis lipoprotein|nr:FAD:protein FMN transferase [Desulfovibrio sp.]